jgi:hypothetical protein
MDREIPMDGSVDHPEKTNSPHTDTLQRLSNSEFDGDGDKEKQNFGLMPIDAS